MAYHAILLVLAFTFLATTQANPNIVSIYYESLCQDSINFITTQFTPTYEILGSEYIKPDYLPYGKATHQQLPNGTWVFLCQHGPEECRGNKMMACAIKYITDDNVLVQFMNCVMGNAYPPDAGQMCAAAYNVAWNPIDTCWGSTEGDDLLAAYGDRTHALTPPIAFVPTIVYNPPGVFDQADQDESLVDFMGVVCRHLDPVSPDCPPVKS